MKLIQKLNWLLSRYIKELEDIEYDLRHETGIVNVRKAGRANIYRKVIEDLQMILEGEAE